MEKVPSLLSFMTAGIEGNTMHASRRSRSGFTTSTIWGAADRCCQSRLVAAVMHMCLHVLWSRLS